MGTRQSGLLNLKLGDLSKDSKYYNLVMKIAKEF